MRVSGTMNKKLSCRRETACTTLRVIEYFAKSLNVTQDHSKWHPWVWRTWVSISIPLKLCLYLVLFLRYSVSNNGVTLKSGLRILQSRWKWRRLIDHIQLAVVSTKYSFIVYHFRVIWRSNITTLKSWLRATQGHWKLYHSKAWVRFDI